MDEGVSCEIGVYTPLGGLYNILQRRAKKSSVVIQKSGDVYFPVPTHIQTKTSPAAAAAEPVVTSRRPTVVNFMRACTLFIQEAPLPRRAQHARRA